MPDGSNFPTIDLNILPPQYRPKVVPPVVRILWIVAIVVLIISLPVLVFFFRERGQVAGLQDELRHVQSTLQVVRTPAEAEVLLSEELSQTMRLLEEIEAIYPIIEEARNDWPQVLAAVADYDPAQVRLLELVQSENDLSVVGLARSRDEVLSYASRLDRSEAFIQVSIQGMELASMPFDTPVPTATATVSGTQAPPLPGLSTTTPEAALFDPYEPDDITPGYIAIGEVQSRNFYPEWDVDTVEFLGKAGRRYCVMAVPQAMAVDPVLEVKVGTARRENDDCLYSHQAHMACLCPTGGPADSLAAKVEVQVPRTGDEMVLVRVSNRGQFGPEQTYDLQVVEVAGDAWEVDDVHPKPIGVNEVQARSFFPAGDIDRVTFMAKPNVVYRLLTYDLAPGVDTVLTARVGDKTYVNDDMPPDALLPPASGSDSDEEGTQVSVVNPLASLVEFSTPVEQRVYVNVTNKGLYGVNATYNLALTVVGGDIYEPDDYNPKLISPFEEQLHSFYPEGDIDRMLLNVKANVEYIVETFDLADGVDTEITVEVDGQVYHSDDLRRDNIRSGVYFRAAHDGQALITVRNREQYGMDKTYWIRAFPLGPDPTPTPAPAHTPTPDLRDPYEPDQHDPPILAANDIQRRNFYPDGDIDYVRILFSGGRIYELFTRNLAPGVDTEIEVVIEGVTYRNRDVAPDDVSSRIEFRPQFDGEAIAVIRNRGRYGPEQTYDIVLSLIAPGPTATPTPTPTPDLRDPYEPDEVNPPPLLLNEVQRRNFYPDGDIDYATLSLEAGQVYYVRAFGLAPLTEPLLVITVDGVVLRGFPDITRMAEIRLEPATDQVRILEIRNFGGIYGSDRQYDLTLEIDAFAANPEPTLEPQHLPTLQSLVPMQGGILAHPLFQEDTPGAPLRFTLLLRMKEQP